MRCELCSEMKTCHQMLYGIIRMSAATDATLEGVSCSIEASALAYPELVGRLTALTVAMCAAGSEATAQAESTFRANGVNHVALNTPDVALSRDFYVKHLLPLFGSNLSGWLFPGANPARHKSGEQFARQFVKTIKEATGLHFYPHLARHFGAFLYLREKPGAFEIVRRVLAHKSLTTTTRSYASFDDEAAVRLFDSLILRIRDTIRREVSDD